jgi:hypothetical protein
MENVKHLKPFTENEWEQFPQAQRWDDGVEPYWAVVRVQSQKTVRKTERHQIAAWTAEQQRARHPKQEYVEEPCFMMVDRIGITIIGHYGCLRMKVADRDKAILIAERYRGSQPIPLSLLQIRGAWHDDGENVPFFEGCLDPWRSTS